MLFLTNKCKRYTVLFATYNSKEFIDFERPAVWAQAFLLRYFDHVFVHDFSLGLLSLEVVVETFPLSSVLCLVFIHIPTLVSFKHFWVYLMANCLISDRNIHSVLISFVFSTDSGLRPVFTLTKIDDEILWASTTLSGATSFLFLYIIILLFLFANYV